MASDPLDPIFIPIAAVVGHKKSSSNSLPSFFSIVTFVFNSTGWALAASIFSLMSIFEVCVNAV